jgi:hypothetical protein
MLSWTLAQTTTIIALLGRWVHICADLQDRRLLRFLYHLTNCAVMQDIVNGPGGKCMHVVHARVCAGVHLPLDWHLHH